MGNHLMKNPLTDGQLLGPFRRYRIPKFRPYGTGVLTYRRVFYQDCVPTGLVPLSFKIAAPNGCVSHFRISIGYCVSGRTIDAEEVSPGRTRRAGAFVFRLHRPKNLTKWGLDIKKRR